MASGFPGGDPGFYGGGGRSLGNGFSENRFQQYQQQQQHQQRVVAGNPGQQIGYRTPDYQMIGKRSLAEFQASSQPLQSGYFQQAGGGNFMRSMKPRIGGFQNHALSPISPLSPSIDLCSPANSNLIDYRNNSPCLSSVSSLSAASSVRFGAPLYHHHHHHQPNNNLKPNNPGPENGNQKMKASLMELEKYLFDEEGENDAVSAITNSNNEDDDWSQTFQDLISPDTTAATTTTAVTAAGNAIYTSPTSSTSSCSSSKTPPPPPLLAPTPQTPPAKTADIIAEAAAAIVEGKSEEIAETLARLAQAASPTGDPEQRIAFHMLHALRCRAFPGENPPPVGELFGGEHVAGVHALYDLSPCFKFALLSSNLLILEAIASTMQENNGAPKVVVHIVDFDVGHGRQYVNLLRALVERASQTLPSKAPLELKITAVETEARDDGEARERVEGVRESLMRIVAEKRAAARFTLRFNTVTCSVKELTREAIGCGSEETLVANFAFRLYRVPDESVSVENFRDELLRRVRAMQPRVVTVAEQELSANTAPFVARVGDCTGYYGALIESLAQESPDRARVEEAVGRKAANAVACEGRERVERCEVFGKWRARMGMAGFKAKPVGRGVAESMRANLMNPAWGGNPSCTVKEENGGVCFGWMGRTLTVASAWR